MGTFIAGGVSIHYEELGSGFPLLLLAPGGLNSTIDAWTRAAINPLEAFSEDFHLIAMDQRNAGGSTGPFEPEILGEHLSLISLGSSTILDSIASSSWDAASAAPTR